MTNIPAKHRPVVSIVSLPDLVVQKIIRYVVRGPKPLNQDVFALSEAIPTWHEIMLHEFGDEIDIDLLGSGRSEVDRIACKKFFGDELKSIYVSSFRTQDRSFVSSILASKRLVHFHFNVREWAADTKPIALDLSTLETGNVEEIEYISWCLDHNNALKAVLPKLRKLRKLYWSTAGMRTAGMPFADSMLHKIFPDTNWLSTACPSLEYLGLSPAEPQTEEDFKLVKEKPDTTMALASNLPDIKCLRLSLNCVFSTPFNVRDELDTHRTIISKMSAKLGRRVTEIAIIKDNEILIRIGEQDRGRIVHDLAIPHIETEVDPESLLRIPGAATILENLLFSSGVYDDEVSRYHEEPQMGMLIDSANQAGRLRRLNLFMVEIAVESDGPGLSLAKIFDKVGPQLVSFGFSPEGHEQCPTERFTRVMRLAESCTSCSEFNLLLGRIEAECTPGDGLHPGYEEHRRPVEEWRTIVRECKDCLMYKRFFDLQTHYLWENPKREVDLRKLEIVLCEDPLPDFEL